MADRDYSYDPVDTGAPVNQQAHRMEQGQVWRQYIIAGVANIAILSTGVVMGWTSPVIVKLLDKAQSPLPEPISGDQGAWIGSLFTVGAVFGPFIAGYLAASVGRKWSVLSCSVPLLIGWILIAVARSVGFIYAGRIVWGVGAGMLFTVSPMYCAEIATDDSRGALGSYLQVFITLGFLIVYALDSLSYINIAYVGIALVCVFATSFLFMPDSPIYYLTKNDKESAARCLMTLRGRTRAGVESELDKMQADVQASMAKTATIADVFRGSNFKAFYISCALFFFQQWSGVNAVLFYLTTIFNAAGSDLEPATATIIVGAVQVLASLMTSFLVDRLGRRILLLISTTGTAVALGLLGIYFILDPSSPVAERLSFLPLLLLMLFIITYCWGIGPLPFAIMSELFPVEVKTTAAPIATAFSWVLTFVVTRYFKSIADAVGMYSAFWIFSVSCALGFFFTLFVVPETKGKSFSEIQDMLAGNTNSSKCVKNHDSMAKC